MKLSEALRRVLHRLRGRVISLYPQDTVRGHVLLSYFTHPFLADPSTLTSHTNYWEVRRMAEEFLERGYTVDVIDTTNAHFIPKKPYIVCIDTHNNLERLAKLLDPHCLKIFHATTAHWKFQNDAELTRVHNIRARRGITLSPDRPLSPSRAIEVCDTATVLGNKFTQETYAFAGKPMVRIPISTTHMYERPTSKDWGAVRRNFIWLGGAGPVHKGLDLVLEAFAQIPEYHLTVCGKINPHDPFARAYHKELYETENIRTAGFVDPGSKEFASIHKSSIGIVYPSCAEGGGGSVILAMHAGLIPIVSYETSVDTQDFGVLLKESTVEAIKAAVEALAQESDERLRTRALQTWEYARTHHTREIFAERYARFVDSIEKRVNDVAMTSLI